MDHGYHKKPFTIGDRITIGDVSGEVYDITLTHICIDEVGGSINSDQVSGRNIIIPNHLLFEHNIINYTLTNDYVLGEVVTSITYESDLDKATKLIKDSAIKFVGEHVIATKKEPVVRIRMDSSCVDVKLLFFAPIKVMQEIRSNITKEILDKIRKEKGWRLRIHTPNLYLRIKNYLSKF